MADLLVEGIDFYYENGFIVFTEEYLKKRGYCCRSGCRHCPYGYQPEPDDRDSSESPTRWKIVTGRPRQTSVAPMVTTRV